MRIGIIGDTHFGASYNLGKIDPTTQHNSRLLDFSNTFDSIISRFLSMDVTTVVLTGDIFETRHPTSAQLNAFSRCMRQAVESGLEMHIVVGNHDQQRIIDTTTVDIYDELKLSNVFIYPEMSVYTKDSVNIITMPYRDRRMLQADTNSGAIQMLRENLNEVAHGLSGFKLVVGHMMLDRTDIQDNPDGFSINELILPHDMFNGMDMVVMGHVHRHSVISPGTPTIIYSGSMEKVSFGEKDHKKVSLVIDTENETVDIVPSKVRNLYEISLNYDNGKNYNQKINDAVMKDIDEFANATDLTGSVVKLTIRLSELDNYHLNQIQIREHLLDKNIDNFFGLTPIVARDRQLRNKEITEDVSPQKAMDSYIDELQESDVVKRKLRKGAHEIISEVNGK